MNFGNIQGRISHVPLERYEDLISTYVEKVSKVQGVISIVQIGSFTAPGLSDIDIILIVDDRHPPRFEDISIKKTLKDKSGAEVIAHDVFIYPASLSKWLEGLFYIDNKKLLFGQPIGGGLSSDKAEKLKLILSFEYTIHRLETLIALTNMPVVSIRDILLFISTLRHTYKLLADFQIITREESQAKVKEIEELRTQSIGNGSNSFKDGLGKWIVPCFIAIFSNAIKLGDRLGYNTFRAPKKWILNYKKLIITFDEASEAAHFFIRTHFTNKKFKGKVVIEPMPSAVHAHIQHYRYPSPGLVEMESLTPIALRYQLAVRHAAFLTRHHYPIARTYTIIDYKRKKFTDHLKIAFLKSMVPILKLK